MHSSPEYILEVSMKFVGQMPNGGNIYATLELAPVQSQGHALFEDGTRLFPDRHIEWSERVPQGTLIVLRNTNDEVERTYRPSTASVLSVLSDGNGGGVQLSSGAVIYRGPRAMPPEYVTWKYGDWAGRRTGGRWPEHGFIPWSGSERRGLRGLIGKLSGMIFRRRG